MYPDFESELTFETACEPRSAYRLNRELAMAWDLAEHTGSNLFLTGRAGTGKTTFLRKLRELSSKRMIVLAPTGVAAINAQGSTIHSFFQFPFAPFLPGKGFLANDKKFLNFSRHKRRIVASLSMIVIDEVSMVRPDILDAIDMQLRRLRKSQRPFGGVQLLLIGDLRQLPPVVRDDEWSQLKGAYPTPYFYESHALKRAGMATIELSTVYRQSDFEFISLLNAVRDGNTDGETLKKLNARFIDGFRPGDGEGYIRLTTHNRLARNINNARLDGINAPEHTYQAEKEGDFPDASFPGEIELRLKKGAQVMFIKNDTGSARRFYNGMLGIVEELSSDKIMVRPLNGGEPIDVERMEWENTRYAMDEASKRIAQEIVGTMSQYPLRLAWAITIHKSQGLTFDKALIDASLSFAPGQTYVALSRCRSLEGLVLGAPIPPQAVITDNVVTGFIRRCEQNAPTPESVEAMKREYAMRLLAELFDFTPIRLAYEDFQRHANEYLVPLNPSLHSRLSDLRDALAKDCEEIGRKFIAGLTPDSVKAGLESEQHPLGERIRKGCRYFHDILDGIYASLGSLPRELGNRAYSETLNRAYANLDYPLGLKLRLLAYFTHEDFSAENFLDAMALAILEMENAAGKASPGKSTPRQSVKREKAKGKPKEKSEEPAYETSVGTTEDIPEEKKTKRKKGYSAYATLRLFREGKTMEQIAAERNLALVTIGSHLGDAVAKGLIGIESLIAPDLLARMRKALEASPDGQFGETYEALCAAEPDKDVPRHLFSLFWNSRKK